MNLQQAALIAEALSDLTRLKIARRLADRPHCGEELVSLIGLSASTISFHLRKLENAELVTKHRHQYYSEYSLNRSNCTYSLLDLITAENPDESAEQQRRQRSRIKVFQTYFKRGRLLKLPTQLKKRMLILEKIAAVFQDGISYSEQQVNALIEPMYDDYCLIRRLLVDEGYLDRKDGNYWRACTSSTDAVLPSAPSGVPGSIPHPPLQPRPKAHKEKIMNSRTEIKKSFKEQTPPVGAFVIKNKENSKVLLVVTLNIPAYITRHEFELSLGSHPNKELQADWKKLGKNGFVFEVIEEIPQREDGIPIDRDDILALEKKWFEKLKPFATRGYNPEPTQATFHARKSS
jgi:biotin operon repressor